MERASTRTSICPSGRLREQKTKGNTSHGDHKIGRGRLREP